MKHNLTKMRLRQVFTFVQNTKTLKLHTAYLRCSCFWQGKGNRIAGKKSVSEHSITIMSFKPHFIQITYIYQRTMRLFLQPITCLCPQCTPAARTLRELKLEMAKTSMSAMTRHWASTQAWPPAPPANNKSWVMSPTRPGDMPGSCACSSSALGECPDCCTFLPS